MANVQLAVAGDETTQVILSVPGVQGPAGSNLPPSGTTNQVLYKQSSTDYDTAWSLVTSAMITDGTIVNGDINASAAIAGTKISPDFGSQNVVTTGTATAASFIPTSSGVPGNGLYLPSANNVAISTGGSGRLFVDASGNVGVGVSPSAIFEAAGSEPVFGLNHHVTQYLTSTKAYNATPGGGIALRYKYNSANDYTYGAGISFEKDNTVDGDFGSHITIQTRPNNGSATERLRITSAGLVGVGASSPYSRFTVIPGTTPTSVANANQITIGEASQDSKYRLQLGYFVDGTYKGSIQAYDFNNPAQLILNGAGGNVGIGTSSPGAQTESRITGGGAAPATSGTSQPNAAFRVSGTGTTGVLDIGCNGSAPWIQSTDRTDLSQKYSLLLNPNGGSVGIGTTNPSQLLTLQQTSAGAAVDCLFLNNSSVNANTSVGISFGPNVSNTVDRSAVIRGINESDGSGNATGLQFLTNANGASPTEKARIDSSGRLLVGTSSNSGAPSSGAVIQLADQFSVRAGNGGGITNRVATTASATTLNCVIDVAISGNIYSSFIGTLYICQQLTDSSKSFLAEYRVKIYNSGSTAVFTLVDSVDNSSPNNVALTFAYSNSNRQITATSTWTTATSSVITCTLVGAGANA